MGMLTVLMARPCCSLCVLTGEADFEAANALAATARSRVTIGGCAPYITRV